VKKNISLIIPAFSSSFYIEDFLINILFWTTYPSEIIIVNTSDKNYIINTYLKKKLKKKKINLKFIFKKNLFPGAARNVGIANSKYEYIAFLDMNTLPYNKDWLKINYDYIIKNNLDGLCGQTIYLANNYIEKVVRASTYGTDSLRTIPGSIFKKKVVAKVGKFDAKSRAGEDTDWLKRLEQYSFKFKDSIEPIFYKGLFNIDYIFIIKKWFRNYYLSSTLPHLKDQKNFYFLILFVLFFLFIFNWNYSSLCLSSEVYLKYNCGLYIPHITKIFLLISSMSYLMFRGIIMPLKKKIKLNFLFPYGFLFITIFSFILDLVKSTTFLALIFSKFSNLRLRIIK
jgi:glycosyltransferase involved in cell wall biosynthesis